MKRLLSKSPTAIMIALILSPVTLWAECNNSGSAIIKCSELEYDKEKTKTKGLVRSDIHISIDDVAGIELIDLTGTSANNDSIFRDITDNITTLGNNSQGILAITGVDATIDLTSNGAITTQGDNSSAIHAKSDAGIVSVINHGSLHTQGQNSSAILAETTGSSLGYLHIVNTAQIEVENAQAIIGRANNGNVYVNALNNITAGQLTSSNNNHGIEVQTKSDGEANVTYNNGKLTVMNDSSGASIGILAWDGGTGASDVDGHIHLGSDATVDASRGATGLEMQISRNGAIEINAGAKVIGGSYAGISFISSGSGSSLHTLNNSGEVSSLNDRAIVSNVSGSGSSTVINNTGTITGYVNFTGSDVTFNNMSSNSWNLRHYYDSDGDGIRDTKGVAVADFGSGYAVYNNESNGTLRLSAVSGDSSPSSTIGQYLPNGSLSISNAGIVQGQLLNLDRFENRGLIDLTENGLAGDVLVISGSSTAGGGGNQFISDGGSIYLDTVLNEGGANSRSDILVVDDVITGVGGPTEIYIKVAGGSGALTQNDGIKIIDVHGTSASDSFKLGNIVRGGAYEYTLFQGSPIAAGDYSWYLRSSARQLNPDIGSYLGNRQAATSLFMHSLHDRIGESQYSERYKQQGTVPSVWVRTVMGHSKNKVADGALEQSNDSYLVHLGGEIAQWTNDGLDRYHLGVMGAYGRSENKTRSDMTNSQVKGNIHGYGTGVYFTWFDNVVSPEGWYADIWSMYSWFNNETESIKKYRSQSWINSIEVGYAVKMVEKGRWQGMIEPHGQIAYSYYHVDDHVDNNSLTITNDNANGTKTRLGARMYLKDKFNRMNAQPFIETNWIHTANDNRLTFDGDVISDDVPKNRFEAKVGVQGEITPSIQLYSHIGMQWGKDKYERSEGQIGFKYRF